MRTLNDRGAAPRDSTAARRHNLTSAGSPDGSPVLLAHGFGTSQEMWHRLTPGLAEHHLLLMDHVGSGGSDVTAYSPRRYQSLHGYAQDVVALLDELEVGPVDYVGHSAGAMIGVLASVQRPELFRSLVLISGSPRYIDDGDYTGGFSRQAVEEMLATMEANYLAFTRSLAPLAMGNDDRPELAEELARTFARNQERIATDFARAIFLSDFRAELPAVSVPTLVVQPAEDPMVPAAVGHHLHSQIPGSRLALLDATGHFPHVSGPDETTRVIRDFLASLA